MSVTNQISSNIFNAEFLNSPSAAIAAWISIFLFVIAMLRIVIKTLFEYRNSHNVIFKKSGIPAFVLNFFFIRISLKKLPAITWFETAVTILFCMLFLYSTYFLGSTFIKAINSPANSALLYWKKTGESFYISNKLAVAATISSTPGWKISKDDCVQSPSANADQFKLLTIEHKDALCKLFTTNEGKVYIEMTVKKFIKDRIFIYSTTPTILFILLWLTLGVMLTTHYSKKVRKYILTEQKNAIHWAKGEFKTEGIYSIYKELEQKPRH